MEGDLSLLGDEFELVLMSEHQVQLKKPFRLLDLPPELWLIICGMAVIYPNPILITKATDSKGQMAMLRQPAITKTCRLIRREALRMFYRGNSFRMDHSYGVACPRYWMHAIGTQNLEAMGSVVIECRDGHEFWAGCFERAGISATIRTLNPDEHVHELDCRFNCTEKQANKESLLVDTKDSPQQTFPEDEAFALKIAQELWDLEDTLQFL